MYRYTLYNTPSSALYCNFSQMTYQKPDTDSAVTEGSFKDYAMHITPKTGWVQMAFPVGFQMIRQTKTLPSNIAKTTKKFWKENFSLYRKSASI